MEIKQDLKLSQQLVMTPQLQQAIKLLQLSRMELVDLVRDEMLENPILEDAVESATSRSRRARRARWRRAAAPTSSSAPARPRRPIARLGVDERRHQAEVKARRRAQAVNEIDWENYLDNYTIGAADAVVQVEQRGAAVARSRR